MREAMFSLSSWQLYLSFSYTCSHSKSCDTHKPAESTPHITQFISTRRFSWRFLVKILYTSQFRYMDLVFNHLVTLLRCSLFRIFLNPSVLSYVDLNIILFISFTNILLWARRWSNSFEGITWLFSTRYNKEEATFSSTDRLQVRPTVCST